MSRKETSSHPAPTATATTTATNITSTTSKQSHFNVIESLKEYNRSQTNKILCIDNDTSTLDHDAVVVVVVDGATHDSDMRQLPQSATITKTVVCFACVLLLLLTLFCFFSTHLFCYLKFGRFFVRYIL